MSDPKSTSARKIETGTGTQQHPSNPGRLQSTGLKLDEPVDWRTVRAWGLGSGLAKTIVGVLAAIVALWVRHLSQLLTSQATTQDQWAAAVRVKSDWQYVLLAVFVLSIFVMSRRTRRTQQYLAKLPNAPTVSWAKAAAGGPPIPALWPPVPTDQPSWTRRFPWPVPAAIGFIWAIVLFAADFADERMAVSVHKFTVVETLYLCVTALGLLSAAIDLIRLRYLARWPRPAEDPLR
jgi:amino acid transporter